MSIEDEPNFSNEETGLEISPIGKSWEKGEDINYSQICFVRACELQQISIEDKNGEKQYKATTAITGTKGEIPRVSVHWSLNHKVESHMNGNWDSASVVLICPGETTVELNGDPYGLTGFDSWWTKDVKLPSNSIIITTNKNNTPLSEKEENQWKDLESSIVWHYVSIDRDLLHRKEEIDNQYEENQRQLNELQVAGTPTDHGFTDRELLDRFKKLSGERYIVNAEIDNVVRDAVDKIVNTMGYSIFRDAGTYMMDEGLDNAIHALRNRHDIPNGGHSYSPEAHHDIRSITLARATANENEVDNFFQNIVGELNAGLTEQRKYTAKDYIDSIYLNVELGELFHVMSRDYHIILRDPLSIQALSNLFIDHPDVASTLSDWAKSEPNVENLINQAMREN